ncbi:endo-beta-N-acetylglucosaminidase [Lederbergia sp. NSJ-179]|uniref:endo-beta-N-acetylglucosaminidase n=1 Tax=Lederbergia sp. NSJ-179 TaxID=2931402 RepID=UPI001FD318B7|nr:endo-beta-N-acetylglucosaminidase [Lederbergia sp. NSJ-179]MCJ7843213.1 endo-beta-N-acetylglucosaminidase [Lederbergia sp. NSJ-179]
MRRKHKALFRAFMLLGIAFSLAIMGTSIPVSAGDTAPIQGQGEKGKTQPFAHGYRVHDILEWTPELDPYAEYLRARVPLQTRNAPFAATQANPSLSPETQLLNLAGDYGNAFFESYQYNDHFASMLHNFWQYTDIFASWHGMPTSEVPEDLYDPNADWTERHFEFGILNLPNPAYTNAAHKNGSFSLGTIFLPRPGQTHSDLLVKDADDSFPVAEKLVEMAEYFGFDGYFINQETNISAAEVPLYKEFMKAMKDRGMYIQWYDSVTDPTGRVSYQNEFNIHNSPFVKDNLYGQVSNSIFLNYWWNKQRIENSKRHAESLNLDPYQTVFTGVEGGMYKFNQPYDLRNILDGVGNPKTSIAVLGSEFVLGELDADTGLDRTDNTNQHKVFERERLWWSGPNLDPTLATRNDDYPRWDGIASYIAERSVVSGNTFITHFSTGHGLHYYKNGEILNQKEWSNINIQDILPTWQWWFDTDNGKDPTLQVDFDYGQEYESGDQHYEKVGAYTGGSSLAIHGDVATDHFLRLFKTDLSMNKDTNLTVSYRKTSTDDVNMKLGLIFKDHPEKVIYEDIQDSKKAHSHWQTGEINLNKYAGKELAAIGFAFTIDNQVVKDYQINIGELKISDGQEKIPAKPSGFTLDKAYNTNEMKVSWVLADYDEVKQYNLYAKLSNGETVYLGGTYDDKYYIKSLYGENNQVVLQVRAVGADGTESDPAELIYQYDHEVKNLQTEEHDDFVKVSWENPTEPAPLEVSIVREYENNNEIQTVRVEAGDTSVELPIEDADGSRYSVTVKLLNKYSHGITHSSRLKDIHADPYDGEFHIHNGKLTLDNPQSKDWHYMYVYVNGELILHSIPNQNRKSDYLIRGVSPLIGITSVTKEDNVKVILEDYAGNRSKPTWMKEIDINLLLDTLRNFEGEIEDDIYHSLELHLTAVGHYEKQGAGTKVVKHLKSFGLLIKQQKESGIISEEAHNQLKISAEELISKWR